MSKQLIKQLNNIKVEADPQWKSSTREFLLSRVKQSQPDNLTQKVLSGWANLLSAPRFAWKPVGVFSLIALFVFGGSGLTIAVAHQSNPGDPLFAVKRGLEEFRLATVQDASRKVILANGIFDNRIRELEQVATELATNDQDNTVDLAVNEVEKQIKVVNIKFKELKDDDDNQEMVATALGLNKKMVSYRKELKQVKTQVDEQASTKINQVLDEVDDINSDVLAVIVAKHDSGDSAIKEEEVVQSLEEHINQIEDKAEEVLAALGSAQEGLAQEAKDKIEEANQALAKGEYMLGLTLADDSNDILKMLYGAVNQIISVEEEGEVKGEADENQPEEAVEEETDVIEPIEVEEEVIVPPVTPQKEEKIEEENLGNPEFKIGIDN